MPTALRGHEKSRCNHGHSEQWPWHPPGSFSAQRSTITWKPGNLSQRRREYGRKRKYHPTEVLASFAPCRLCVSNLSVTAGIMELLSQFLLRLVFGLAVGMAITSPKQVSSGYFRNHLYVTLGLATLAALAVAKFSLPAAWLAGAAAMGSFIGAACWLYESRRAGQLFLWFVAICGYVAAVISAAGVGQAGKPSGGQASLWQPVEILSSGLVIGLTLAAMLLGHWYLNSPDMKLAPLRRLIACAAMAVAVQALISAAGLAAELSTGATLSTNLTLFLLLRWSFGLFGVAGLLWMAWRTLEIPNTQSATGILYVAVIGVFVGELAAALLSAESAFPL
jgi:hypothetical protein